MNRNRVIAFYLPQFHPNDINDKYWGKGFTEWTNVTKAKPLFRGHYQPQLPADLGFYDLRLSEVREEQASLAKQYGIEGFCYWHYWFGNGKKILERPFNEVLSSGKPDYPFCLGWANHSWSNKTWEKSNLFSQDIVFLEQTYPGKEDYIAHFYDVLPAFKDSRYITVDGKPLFLVFNPANIPDNKLFLETWRTLAIENGLPGIHFVGRVESKGRFSISKSIPKEELYNKFLSYGYDAIAPATVREAKIASTSKAHVFIKALLTHFKICFKGDKYDYGKLMKHLYCEDDKKENFYPLLYPRFDNTPRRGNNAWIFVNSSPALFEQTADSLFEMISKKEPEHRIVFLVAWNEWGEGSYMEPDIKYKHQYLQALRNALTKH